MSVRTNKPRQRQTSLKAMVDQATRMEKPESEMLVYEFGNGRGGKKAGKGPYGPMADLGADAQ